MWQESGGVCRVCKCCSEHSVSFCGLYTDFPCEWLAKWFDGWNKNGIEKLKQLRTEYRRKNDE